MKTSLALLCLIMASAPLGPSVRADVVVLKAAVPSTTGLAPDGTATDLMPYPIYGFSIQSLAFSPDGRTLAAGDGNGVLRLWDPATGELRASVAAHQGWVFSIAWFRDGQRLATGGKDRFIRIRDAANPARLLKTFEGHTNDVHAVAITSDGALLASAGDDKTIRVWDVATGEAVRILTGHTRQIPALALDPTDRLIASSSRDQTVRLWDLRTGQETGAIRAHSSDVMSVKFSPDGKRLASASYDQTVRLWDAQTLVPMSVLTGHTYRVYSTAFAPNGRQVASAGDHTARLWDTADGRNVKTFALESEIPPQRPKVRGAVSVVAYSPDGQKLAIGSTLGTIHLVSPDTGALLQTLTPPPPPPPLPDLFPR